MFVSLPTALRPELWWRARRGFSAVTARSQVERLRRAADRAARVARENARLDYALEDIEVDLRYAAEKARSKLRALDFAGLQVEEELAATSRQQYRHRITLPATPPKTRTQGAASPQQQHS